MNERLINYISKQKDWFITMNGYLHDYHHRSEATDIYFCHMSTPKIDRTGMFPKIWRWQ